MSRENIVLIKGNHEDIALNFLSKACISANFEQIKLGMIPKDMIDITELWIVNGCETTLAQLLQFDLKSLCKIRDFLDSIPEYIEVFVDDKQYILVHAGLANFKHERKLDSYSTQELIWDKVDYNKTYFSDKYLVTGHTPTEFIDRTMKGKIIKKNNHIAIDCGCCYGGKLGCICLETGEEFYMDRQEEDRPE